MTFGFSWHSHSVMVCQPKSRSSMRRLRSRSRFLRILFSQNGVLVLGSTKYLQTWCPCQKQPLMKMAVLYFLRTISGEPGSFFTLSLYLNPRENRNLRTRSSGLVSLLLMLCMHFRRCWGFILSAIRQRYAKTHQEDKLLVSATNSSGRITFSNAKASAKRGAISSIENPHPLFHLQFLP